MNMDSASSGSMPSSIEAPIYMAPISEASSSASVSMGSGSAPESPQAGSLGHTAGYYQAVYYPMYQFSPGSMEGQHQYYSAHATGLPRTVLAGATLPSRSPKQEASRTGMEVRDTTRGIVQKNIKSREETQSTIGYQNRKDSASSAAAATEEGEEENSPHSLIPAVIDSVHEDEHPRQTSPGKAIFARFLKQEGYSWSSDDEIDRCRTMSKRSLKLERGDVEVSYASDASCKLSTRFDQLSIRKKIHKEIASDPVMDETNKPKSKKASRDGVMNFSSEKTVLKLNNRFQEMLRSLVTEQKNGLDCVSDGGAKSCGHLTLGDIAKAFCRFYGVDTEVLDPSLGSVLEFSKLLVMYQVIPVSMMQLDGYGTIERSPHGDRNSKSSSPVKLPLRPMPSTDADHTSPVKKEINLDVIAKLKIHIDAALEWDRTTRLNARQRRTLRRAQQRAEKALFARSDNDVDSSCSKDAPEDQNNPESLESVLVAVSVQDSYREDGSFDRVMAKRIQHHSPIKGTRPRPSSRPYRVEARDERTRKGTQMHSPQKDAKYKSNKLVHVQAHRDSWNPQGVIMAPISSPLHMRCPGETNVPMHYSSHGLPYANAASMETQAPCVRTVPIMSFSGPVGNTAMHPPQAVCYGSPTASALENQHGYHHHHPQLVPIPPHIAHGHVVDGGTVVMQQHPSHDHVFGREAHGMVYYDQQMSCMPPSFVVGPLGGQSKSNISREKDGYRRKLSRFAPKQSRQGNVAAG